MSEDLPVSPMEGVLDPEPEMTLPEGVTMAELIRDYTNRITEAKAEKKALAPMKLDGVFPGEDLARFRDQITKTGVVTVAGHDGNHTIAVDVDSSGNVMHVAAAIPRTPSRAQDYLDTVADFKLQGKQVRDLQMARYRRIYQSEGLINNAISKVTALVATDFSFKVRRIKGVKGKGSDKRGDEFLQLLQYWMENVNSPGEDGVVQGGRGMKAFISQGVRQALIEGDHFARTNWTKVKVASMKGATFSLPINIQTFSGGAIEIPEAAAAFGIDYIYWKPAKSLIDAISKNEDKDLTKEIQKLIPKDVLSALKKDGRYRLDSKLMAHIKHRGTMDSAYGESFIQAAMGSIAYKRALQALDIVTIENLINRLLIIKIGSDDVKSVYHKQEVSASRLKNLENMMRRIGPHSTLLWAGPDIEILEAGAHSKILEMDGRYTTARSMMREDIGTPSALLTGEGSDGKSSALAAIVAVAAQIQELQDQYAQTLRTWAQQIGEVNGYEDVDVQVEARPNPLINKAELIGQMIQAYQLGVLPLRTLIENGFSLDYETVVELMAEEVGDGFRDEAFGVPKGIPQTTANGLSGGPTTTNPGGGGGGGGGKGRPTKKQTGKPDPRNNKEVPKPTT